VHKDRHLLWPRAETPTSYISMGFSADLKEATTLRGVRDMINFLVDEKHLSRDEAYMLTSVAVGCGHHATRGWECGGACDVPQGHLQITPDSRADFALRSMLSPQKSSSAVFVLFSAGGALLPLKLSPRLIGSFHEYSKADAPGARCGRAVPVCFCAFVDGSAR